MCTLGTVSSDARLLVSRNGSLISSKSSLGMLMRLAYVIDFAQLTLCTLI